MKINGSLVSGILAMTLVVVIYSSSIVFGRYSVQNGLDPYDITALRFVVSSLILLPFFLKQDVKSLNGLGWGKGIVLATLAGAPYMMLLFAGLTYAPSAHAGVLNSGIVPTVVFLGMIYLGLEKFTLIRMLCLLLILPGLALVTISSSGSQPLSNSVLFGDLILFITGVMWGTFTLLCKYWEVKAMQAVCIVGVLSVVYLPIYAIFFYDGIEATWAHIFAQAFFQGIIASIVGIVLLTYALKKMGSANTSLFSPLVPILTVILAVIFLGEELTFTQSIGILLVIMSMFLSSIIKPKKPLDK